MSCHYRHRAGALPDPARALSATRPVRPLAGLSPIALSLQLTLGAAAVASLCWAPRVHAQQTAPAARQYAIPAGPLTVVLNRFGEEAGIFLSGAADLTQGKRSPGLSGSFTPAQGLAELLRGHGLQAVPGANGAYRLARLPQASQPRGERVTLPAITVTGAAAGTPPPAYAGGQVAAGGRVGLLGNKDFMDTPFSVTQYTSELIDDQQAQNLGDVLVNDASVRNTYSRGAGRDEFNVRGFTLFNYDVSYNGLYGITPPNSSALIGIERVEVLRGPSALLNGMAPSGSVGGAINLVPKRADAKPLNRMTLSYIDEGQLGGHVDFGRRYGESRQWGVRLNGLYRSGDTPVKHSKEDLGAFSLGLDYQGEHLRVDADLNYQDRLTHARSGLLFPAEPGVPVGDAPDARGNFFPAWTYWKTKEWSGTVRAEVDLASDWVAYGTLGGMKYDFSSLQTSWLMLDGQGNIGAIPARLNERLNTFTGEAGVRGKLRTGALVHEPVLSGSFFNMNNGQQRVSSDAIIFSNIYTPLDIDKPVLATPGDIPRVSESRLHSIALADTLSMADGRVQLVAGARYQQIKSRNFDSVTGSQTAYYNESAVTPAVALTVKPVEKLSLYSNYIEGLGQGPTAPTAAVNAGEVFPPAISRQMEIGAKYDFGRFAATLSAFQIKRPSSFLDPATMRFTTDGQQRNRGVELTAFGEVSRRVRLLAGASLTDGKLVQTQGDANNGKTAPAVPRYQVNLSGEWDPSFLSGLTLTGRMVYTSSQYVDVANTQKIPAWTRFDLGLRYAFIANDTPITVRATIENVLDKNYWQSAAREGLTIGAPRTFLLSVAAEF